MRTRFRFRYKVWHQGEGESEFTQLDGANGEMGKVLENLAPDRHTFRVRGVNDSGERRFSNEVTMTKK